MTGAMVKDKKPFAVKTSIFAACMELAGGRSATAGGLLCQIAIRSREGDKTLKDGKGVPGWLALTAEQWRSQTGFTRHQHDGAIKRLKKKGLILSKRKKVRRRDPAAVAWIRLPDTTKSAIAEIMARPAISAFADKAQTANSALTENTAHVISGEAEQLNEMKIIENENGGENVVIEATTTLENTSTLEKEETQEKEKKKTANKSSDKKDWFNETSKEMYDGSGFSPEPFKEDSAKILLEAKEYLEGNPGGLFEFFPEKNGTYIYALSRVIKRWDEFAWFASTVFNGYSIPTTPQLWSIRHQLKAVPDFVKFRKYCDDLMALFAAEEIPVDDKADFLRDIESFYKYVKIPAEEREDFLNKVMKSSGFFEHHKAELEKWKKLAALSNKA